MLLKILKCQDLVEKISPPQRLILVGQQLALPNNQILQYLVVDHDVQASYCWNINLSGGVKGAEGIDIRVPGSFCQFGSKILSDEY